MNSQQRTGPGWFIGHVTETRPEAERTPASAACACAPQVHRLASRDVIHARDLEGELFVSIARQNGSREHVDSLFEKAKVTRKIEVEAENASSICHLVAQGLGVSVLNAVIAEDFRCHGLVVREFAWPSISITLLRSSHRPRSLLVAAFIDSLGAVLNGASRPRSSPSATDAPPGRKAAPPAYKQFMAAAFFDLTLRGA